MTAIDPHSYAVFNHMGKQVDTMVRNQKESIEAFLQRVKSKVCKKGVVPMIESELGMKRRFAEERVARRFPGRNTDES